MFVLYLMLVVAGIRICVIRRVDVVLVSVVHPVSIQSAVFCIIRSSLMFVSDASCDYMVETYSSLCFIIDFHVASIVSFCF